MKKRGKKSKPKEFTLPVWVLDGFVGLLALMIYNFLLYLLGDVAHLGGIIKQLYDSMGYFGINTFLDLGFAPKAMSLGIILMFVVSFAIGIGIGSYIRKRHKN